MKRSSGDMARLGFLLKGYALPYWRGISALIVLQIAETILAAVTPLTLAPILNIAIGKEQQNQAVQSQEISLSNLDLNNIGQWIMNGLGLSGSQNSLGSILVLCGFFLAASTLRNLAAFVNVVLSSWVRASAGRKMEKDLFQRLLAMQLNYYHGQEGAELVSRLESDTRAVAALEMTLREMIMSPLLIVFYGYLMVKTSPYLAFAAVVAAIMHLVLSRGLQKPLRKAVSYQLDVLADVKTYLTEAFMSIRFIKSFCAEKLEIAAFNELVTKSMQAGMKQIVFKQMQTPIRGIINSIIQAGILWFSVRELLLGNLTAPGFLMFIFVGMNTIAPIGRLAASAVGLNVVLASSQRLHQLFLLSPSIVDGPCEIDAFKDCIRLANVSYAYAGLPVLHDVSLEIKRGEMVALVGPSGAGKSTLTDLALRLDDPIAGTVTVDGQDVRSFSQSSYRGLFGVVSQESLLFNTSIRENIAYGSDRINDEEIASAAKTANAHDFIMALPGGYESIVGDRGVRLSGGQRQRIAIARAIYKKPEILIMDEATSSLDSESEKYVQEAIDRIIEGSTAIIIAHRLSTVVHADKIVVMDQGRIIDIGRHHDLFSRCPLYRKQCELQFGDRNENQMTGGIHG